MKRLTPGNELLESVCELDDELLERYLEGDTDIPADRIYETIRKGTIGLKITPVLVGSAFKNKGIQQLLDAVVDFLPSPLDVPPIEGKDEKGRSVHREVDGPLAALAFKVMNDPYTGTLTFLRVYSGKLTSGSAVYNVNAGKKERIGRLVKMHSNQREDVKEAFAGDIIAAVGSKTHENRRYTGGRGSSGAAGVNGISGARLSLWPWNPNLGMTWTSFRGALARLLREDPSLKVRVDHETGQTILSGMGELHLEIIVDRLLREFQVDAQGRNT